MAVDDRVAPARAVVDRVGCRASWVVLALATLPFLVGAGAALPRWIQYLPLVASALVLGLPHGATDHLALARLADRPVVPWALGVVSVVYAVLGGAYLAAWFVAPAASFAFFVLLTWFHWGQGDVYLLAALSDDAYPTGRGHRALTLVVRGGLPMLVPLLSHPGEYRRVADDLVGLFVADASVLAPAFTADARLLAGAGFAACTLAALALGARGPRRWWRFDAVETGLLWAFFLAVPPVLAVGLYFCLWHSVRHIARLVLLDEAGAAALSRGAVAPALSRFARDAAPLTALSLGLLVAAYPLVPRAPSSLSAVVAFYLVFIAVLTLPHVAVVTWMDHRQGVWAGSGPG